MAGIWLAEGESPFFYRMWIVGDSVVLSQSTVSQPIHGYIVLGKDARTATVDLVLEHLGTSRGIYRQAGSDLELALNSKFDSRARPESFADPSAMLIRLHRYSPALEMAEEAMKPAVGGVDLMSPSGPFRVGRRYLHLIDASRDDPNVDDLHQHFRELAVHIWYPTLSGDKRAAYFPNLLLVKKAIGDDGLKEEMEGAYPVVGRTLGHSYVSAPLASGHGKFPLVIFVPGQGLNSTHYTALIEDLVSHGYVVAGIEDTHYADAVVFEKGRTETFSAARWQRPSNYAETLAFDQEISQMLAADISFVANQLRKVPELNASINFGKIGLAGHSVGGRGAAKAAQLDQRFKACANLDGFSPGGTEVSNFGGPGMTCPYMLIRAKDRTPPINEMQSAKMTPRGYRDWSERAFGQRNAFYMRTGSEAGEVSIGVQGYEHASFTDLPLLSPGSAQEVKNRTLAMKLTRNYLRAFFDQNLLGKESALRVVEASDRSGSAVKFFKFKGTWQAGD